MADVAIVADVGSGKPASWARGRDSVAGGENGIRAESRGCRANTPTGANSQPEPKTLWEVARSDRLREENTNGDSLAAASRHNLPV
jgi:hypothetical protein